MPWPKSPKETRPQLDRLAPTSNSKRLDANSRRHGLMPKGLLQELEDAGFGGGGGGGGSSTVTRMEVTFHANGPYRVGTDVDGRIVLQQSAQIQKVTMHRITAGSGGSTIVDLNISGTTAYTTQANRPTITAADGSSVTDATTIPDVTSVIAGQYLSIDIDSAESGNPRDLVLIVEMVPV